MATTIIKLPGSDFSGQGLPQTPQLIFEGLLGAYRAKGTDDSLVDLSGNGRTLTKLGLPTVSGNSYKIHSKKGYDTGVVVTPSLTIAAIYRGNQVNPPAGNSGFALGEFNNDVTPMYGAALWYADSSGGNNTQHRTLQTYLRTSDTAQQFINTNIVQKTYDLRNAFEFIVLTIDSVGNVSRSYAPRLQAAPIETVDYNVSPVGSLANRKLTDSAGVPYTHNIGFVDDNTYVNSDMEVCEALIWNRPLTDAEVTAQYLASKTYWATLGIVI